MILVPPLEGILFDFDGLILDTESPVYQAWAEKFQEYGRQLSIEEWAKIVGRSHKEKGPIEGFLDSLPNHQKETIVQEVSHRERELVQQQKPLPGAVELIKGARKKGLKLGVVSSSDRAWVHFHLERLGLLDEFDYTSCEEDVEEAKPHPALYQLGLQKTGLPAEKVLALEDSPHGVLAAKRAGLYCIAVLNPVTKRLPFYNNGGKPDLMLESLEEFPWDELMKARP
jgi:HAD superfamily hydrolase (TIGR01509 family)